MKGRIPNKIKKHARELAEKYGAGLACHYVCYDVNWNNPSGYESRLVSCLYRLIEQERDYFSGKSTVRFK